MGIRLRRRRVSSSSVDETKPFISTVIIMLRHVARRTATTIFSSSSRGGCGRTSNTTLRWLSASSSSSDANVVTDFEHSTGLYRAELEGLAQGKDIFDHYDFTRAPKGTKESPCVVTSEMDYRVVGVTDPDDDSIVIWGRLEEGKGPMLIGDEWFVHKRVGGGGHC